MIWKRKFLAKKIVLQIINYYEQNDIFLKLDSNFYQAKENLLKISKITHEDLQNFIIITRSNSYTNFRKIIKKNERSKQVFENLEVDVYFKNTLYLKPCLWDKQIVTKIKKVFAKIQKDYLILDLRKAGGGYLTSAVGLCNLLLPKCEIVRLKYKNTQKVHYSDEMYYQFKKIFIIVDRYTASSSEILAYCLAANLNNVILFGEKTFGKTFGQDYIINKKYNFEFILPTFRWFINNFSPEKIPIHNSHSNVLSEIEGLIL